MPEVEETCYSVCLLCMRMVTVGYCTHLFQVFLHDVIG
jgi:hypothetical protein